MFRRFQVSDVVSFELGVMVLDGSNCKDMLVCNIRENVLSEKYVCVKVRQVSSAPGTIQF